MNLYQIDQQIEALIQESVDLETGEILPDASAKLDVLIQDKNQKIINTAKFIKNRSAFVDAMKGEIKKLSERIKSEESKMSWLEDYVKHYMAYGEKYEDPQCVVSLRKTSRVEVGDINLIPSNYRREKVEVSADKKAIAEAIKSGSTVNGAQLIETFSLQIK